MTGINIIGNWNSSLNLPFLSNSYSGTIGDTYVITVSGSGNYFGSGIIYYTQNTLITWNGTTWFYDGPNSRAINTGVTSVGIALPSWYITTGTNPVTTSGTIGIAPNPNLAPNLGLFTGTSTYGPLQLRPMSIGDLPNSPVVPGTYSNPVITVNSKGIVTLLSGGLGGIGAGTVTQVNTGIGLVGGPITNIGTISIANTGVLPGAYTSANVTVNAQGQITNITNGSSSGLSLTTTGTSGAATLIGSILNIPDYTSTIYTFTNGLTNTANTVTNNLITGLSGGQTIIGGTNAGDQLIIEGSATVLTGNVTTSNIHFTNNTLNGSSVAQTYLHIAPTILQTSTAGYTALKLSVTETSNGSGINNLVGFYAGSGGNTLKFAVNNTGAITTGIWNGTVITSNYIGTLTGNQVGISGLSATGTASSTTFLRGDNTWATPIGTTYTGSAGILLSGSNFTLNYAYAGTFTNATWNGIAITGTYIASSVALTGSPTTTTQSSGTNNTTIATTAFVTSAVSTAGSSYVPYTGATGTVNLNGQTITNIANPVSSTDAVTKAYVDASLAGLQLKPTANVATTTVLPSYIYSTGVITMTSTGVVTIDTVALTLGMLVLVKNETSTNNPYNGLYNVTTAGAIGVACVLTRNSEMNTGTEFPGSILFVDGGTNNAGLLFYCTTTGTITVGTTNINFSPITTTVVAGMGISISGNTVSIANTAVTASSYGSSTSIPSFTVNAQGQITVASGNAVIAPAGTLSGTVLNSTVVTSSLTSVGIIGTGTWQATPIATGYIAANAITYAKIQSESASSLLGNPTGSSAVPSEINLGSGLSFSGTTLIATGTGGTVTSVSGSGGTTGLTLTGGPITSTGTLTLGGTLAVANGGTGVTSVIVSPTASAWVGQDANKNYSANNVLEGVTTTSGSTQTLTVASTYQQNYSGGSTTTVTLPVTSTLALGQSFMFMNNNSGILTINSSGGNQVQNLPVGAGCIVQCILLTGTSAASWQVMYLGAANNTGALISPVLTSPSTSAGAITSIDGTQTLSNKRWVARTGNTTSSATPTIDTDNYDIYKITALAANITSFTTNLSGTPNDGDILELQITDNGTARTLSFGSSFVSSSIMLPTTTVTSTTLTILFQYFTTSSYGNNKWVCAGTF